MMHMKVLKKKDSWSDANFKRIIVYLRGFFLKVHRKEGMAEMSGSCKIVAGSRSFLDLETVQMAVSVIIKSSQRRYFSNELEISEDKEIMNKNSSIYKLDPYLDRCGLLRVSDWIQKSALNEEMKHPMLIARKHEISVMIIRWCQEKVAHSGRGITMK